MCRTYHGGGGVHHSLWPGANSVAFLCIKSEFPGQPRGGVRGLQMTNEIQICFSNNKPYKTKFKSVFQSDVKTKKEIHIRFSKSRMRKRKTKNEVLMRFSK